MSICSSEIAASGDPSRQRFFVLNGLSFFLHCHYAPFRRITTPDGQPAKATYQFCWRLMALVREQRPDYMAIVMGDLAMLPNTSPSAHEPDRKELPEDLKPQIGRILEIAASQGMPVFSVPGRKAADLIATLARRMDDQDISIMLVSGNRFLHQLLDDRVALFDPAGNETIGPAELLAQHRYRPDQTVDVLTLDRISGIGRRMAVKLLAQYGTAREAVDHAEQLPPNIRDNVAAFRPLLEATRQSLTLDRDVPVEFDLAACRWRGFDREALGATFRQLGFHRLHDEMMAGDQASA